MLRSESKDKIDDIARSSFLVVYNYRREMSPNRLVPAIPVCKLDDTLKGGFLICQ